MLYDILFIDDDFDKQEDVVTSGVDARTLFFELIRDNLRVTCATGEFDDLERLSKKDLSCIQYIFCDLHLLGISGNSTRHRDIISKLVGIFKHLAQKINSEQITVFINSQFSPDWKKVKNRIESEFTKGDQKRYSFQLIGKKNKISNKVRKDLLKQNLDIHIKSLIINKAIEIEEILDEKLRLSDSARERLNFESKYLVFQSQFLNKSKIDITIKKQLTLLQQIRNKVAHTNNDLKKIKDGSLRKEFWRILGKNTPAKYINFDTSDDLLKYIDSIGKLGEKIGNAQEKNTK